jgi:hypothetical protein
MGPMVPFSKRHPANRRRRSLKSYSKSRRGLIAHLGPMARFVVMNESREAKTPEDLFQRLVARIPGESEKAELLKKLRSLHPG